MNLNSQAVAGGSKETDYTSLLKLISGKDESALSQLYDLTVSRVYGLALKILTNKADAEEVVCDVYSQVWHKAADYRTGRGSAISWLMVICRSRSLDLIRKRRPEIASSDDIDAYLSIEDKQQPEQLIALLQEGSAVKTAMLQLTDIQRQLITLAYFKDLSHKEISAAVQLPLGTVKSHLRRALQSMHSLIEI